MALSKVKMATAQQTTRDNWVVLTLLTWFLTGCQLHYRLSCSHSALETLLYLSAIIWSVSCRYFFFFLGNWTMVLSISNGRWREIPCRPCFRSGLCMRGMSPNDYHFSSVFFLFFFPVFVCLFVIRFFSFFLFLLFSF